MTIRDVPVFFYGSFIIPEVQRQHGFDSPAVRVGRLHGFDICMDPLTRLVRRGRGSVFGIVTEATHAELTSLYSARWMDFYQPYPVLVELDCQSWVPALTYYPQNAIDGATRPPEYLASILEAAKLWNFPDWYRERLREFEQ